MRPREAESTTGVWVVGGRSGNAHVGNRDDTNSEYCPVFTAYCSCGFI